ncbi:MAG: DUF5634 family protein [Desulfuromonadaceae bacterium]|nr:DUF5634 family protein [Desulfuromonadaceae bacterium]
MSDMELYSHYFPVGKKVGVGIPLPNADVFKDWAIIHGINEDLISLQLSRDILPVNVLLHFGQILELRGETENSGYCCRAIVVSEGDARELLLRLIGEVVSDELREFYRIDAFLPIKYFVSHEQNIDILHKQWQERRDLRRQRELEQKDQRWTTSVLPEDAELPHEPHQEAAEVGAIDRLTWDSSECLEAVDNSWDTIIPLAANISGSGLRIIMHHGFEIGEYVLLEIFVPTPQRVIDVIGRVVFANRNHAVVGGDGEYFNTGVQFVHIEERDQDAIVTYISNIQLKRIRQLRERYLFRGAFDSSSQLDRSSISGIKKSTLVVLIIIFLAVLGLVVNYFWYYAQEHPKGEIQQIFENGVKQYRGQTKQN